ILERTIAALAPLQPGLAVEGVSDLAAGGRKVGGSAQQRKRDHLLFHGTLLYAFDLGLIPRYLREPPRQPDYRGGRPHAAFVTNLPVTAAELWARLAAAWEAVPAGAALPAELVARLVEEKYGRPEWARRLGGEKSGPPGGGGAVEGGGGGGPPPAGLGGGGGRPPPPARPAARPV